MSRQPTRAAEHRARILQERIAGKTRGFLLRCTIPNPVTGKPCGRPTSRAQGAGLSAFTCRFHQQHKQRHGSHWCKSPPSPMLTPYITAALKFIGSQREAPFVAAALTGLSALMASAGSVEPATRLRGLTPKRRAKIALARLREAGVKPERLLAIAVAVRALIADAPEKCHRVSEWRIVAIAKAAHRLASGTHRQWPLHQPDGSVKHIVLHAYPRSSGRVLRYLGTMIEKECEWVIERHLTKVVALKRAAKPLTNAAV